MSKSININFISKNDNIDTLSNVYNGIKNNYLENEKKNK